MSEQNAIAGINPATRHCGWIAEDAEDNWLEMREAGLIVVPVTAETAGEIFGTNVDDIYAIARKDRCPLPGGQYYAPDGTLMNADGTRSIFDDVDQ